MDGQTYLDSAAGVDLLGGINETSVLAVLLLVGQEEFGQ